MTVMIGARGSRSSSLSVDSSIALATSALTYSVVKPNSSATMLIVSASRRWLMDTIIPMLIHVAMTCVTETFIMLASSFAVTNSVSCRTLLCSISSLICCMRCSAAMSRFSLRYFADLLPLPRLVKRSSVSFICFDTSSSLTSFLSKRLCWRSRSLRLPCDALLLLLRFALQSLLSFPPFSLTSLMSTRWLLMR